MLIRRSRCCARWLIALLHEPPRLEGDLRSLALDLIHMSPMPVTGRVRLRKEGRCSSPPPQGVIPPAASMSAIPRP